MKKTKLSRTMLGEHFRCALYFGVSFHFRPVNFRPKKNQKVDIIEVKMPDRKLRDVKVRDAWRTVAMFISGNRFADSRR